jgi:HAD superfamily hydrolase (TIGR01509 family)
MTKYKIRVYVTARSNDFINYFATQEAMTHNVEYYYWAYGIIIVDFRKSECGKIMTIKLIIFDNDGVLIDSEILWHQFCAREITRLGYPMTVEKSISLFSGVNHDKPLEEILASEYGLSNFKLDFDKIGRETEASYPSLLKPIDNIHQILEFLNEKKLKKCIASNADCDYIQTTMQITGLKKYFSDDSIFGVEGALRRKPEPDVFLHAANKLDVEPKHCLVIEDHALGIKAAKAANMKVIGFLGATHSKNKEIQHWIAASNPTMIVENAIQLLQVMKNEIDFSQ